MGHPIQSWVPPPISEHHLDQVPGQDDGTPHPGLYGGTPCPGHVSGQVGGTQGTPHLGLDGVPQPVQDWMGYPPVQVWMEYPTCQETEEHSKHYHVAVSMPSAFTQEDFLAPIDY